MTTKKNSHSLSSLLVGATVAAGFFAGCGVEVRPRVPTFRAQAVVAAPVVVAEAGPAQTSPAYASAPMAAPDDVATVGQYQQSGGATAATAELVTIGSTLVGRVAQGAPRYYAIDLAAGDSVNMKAYTRRLHADASGLHTFTMQIIEPDEVKLKKDYTYADSHTEWNRKSMRATSNQTGQHWVKISSSHPVEFRVTISGAVPASF